MKNYWEFLNESISRPSRKIMGYENTAFSNGRLAGYRDVGKINGDFIIIHPNNLTTLEGFPKEIDGDFEVYIAQLSNLKGCPKRINGVLKIVNSGLTSLEGLPSYIRSEIKLNMNKLTSLDGLPDTINGRFDISKNINLVNLKGISKIINGFFNCNDCGLTTLVGGAEYAEGIAVINNPLSSLEGAPRGLNIINHRENLVDLTIEAAFVTSDDYKNSSNANNGKPYWLDLLKYMISKHIDLKKITS